MSKSSLLTTNQLVDNDFVDNKHSLIADKKRALLVKYTVKNVPLSKINYFTPYFTNQ